MSPWWAPMNADTYRPLPQARENVPSCRSEDGYVQPCRWVRWLADTRFDDQVSTTSGLPVDMMPSLIVLSGRPGTGKTTLATAFARHLRACYLRVDAAETALERTGLPVGIEGYAVTHELAVSNLLLGLDVVVDAVNPVPKDRAGWRETAHRGRARLLHVETRLADELEHRRRVEARLPDMRDQHVPSWDEVEGQTWVPWDTQRDGPRMLVGTSDSRDALSDLIAAHEPPEDVRYCRSEDGTSDIAAIRAVDRPEPVLQKGSL